MGNTLKEPRVENTGDSNASNDKFVVEIIINELNSFREFQAKTESKLDKRLSIQTTVKMILKMLMIIRISQFLF